MCAACKELFWALKNEGSAFQKLARKTVSIYTLSRQGFNNELTAASRDLSLTPPSPRTYLKNQLSLGHVRDLGWGGRSRVSMGASLAETPSSGDIDPEVATFCSQAGLSVEG